MDKSAKFLLPAPNFDKKPLGRPKPHFLTPSGMTLLPREKQPPPMYGARGSTVPAKHLPQNQFAAKPHAAPTPPMPTPPQRQYCQGCEMELQSAEDMRRHRAAHELCPVDGCQYSGHASVMDKHVTTKHATGLFEKFKKLSTPEEIAAWREERRKKYPSVANVEMRKAAQEQRQRRGERLEAKTSRFGKREDRKQMRNGTEIKKTAEAASGTEENSQVQKVTPPPAPSKTEMPQRGKGRNEKRANKRRKIQQAKQEPKSNETNIKETVETTKEDEQCYGVCMFRGTSQLKDYKHAETKKAPVATNALMGLLGMYASDSDEEESESEQQAPIRDTSEDDTKINKLVDNVANSEEFKENLTIEADAVATNSADDKSNSPEAVLHVGNASSKEVKELPNNKTKNESKEIIKAIASDDEAPDEAPISHNSSYAEPAPKSTHPAPTNDEPSLKRAKTATGETKKPPPAHQNKRKSGLDYRKARLHKQNTMLEKLLEPDIRHERNVLLQCVRFVCENGFFGIGQSATTPN